MDISTNTLRFIYNNKNHVFEECNEEGKENQPLISEDYQQCKYYYDRLISILNLTLLTRDLEKSGAIQPQSSKVASMLKVVFSALGVAGSVLPGVGLAAHAPTATLHGFKILHYGVESIVKAAETLHEIHLLHQSKEQPSFSREEVITRIAMDLTWNLRHEIQHLGVKSAIELADLHGKHLIQRIAEGKKTVPTDAKELTERLVAEITPDSDTLIAVAIEKIGRYQRCREDRWLNPQQSDDKARYIEKIEELLNHKNVGRGDYSRIFEATRRLGNMNLSCRTLSTLASPNCSVLGIEIPETKSTGFFTSFLGFIGMRNYQIRFSTINRIISLCMLRCLIVTNTSLEGHLASYEDDPHFLRTVFSVEGGILLKRVEELKVQVDQLTKDNKEIRERLKRVEAALIVTDGGETE